MMDGANTDNPRCPACRSWLVDDLDEIDECVECGNRVCCLTAGLCPDCHEDASEADDDW